MAYRSRINRTNEDAVPFHEQALRLMHYGTCGDRQITHASMVADVVYPGHDMHPQGAGLCGARIMARMADAGLAVWEWKITRGEMWRYVRVTESGRKALASAKRNGWTPKQNGAR